MGQLAIHLLGGLQVTLDDKPVTHFATDKARALLAYLAVRAKQPHRREALAGLLWPDTSPAKARHNMRQTLSYVRQAFGSGGDADDFLLVSRETVQFNPECCYYLDVAEFKHLATTCREHHHRRLETCPACMRRMAEMGTLYQGEFLAGFTVDDSCAFEEWALLERESLHRQAITSLDHLAHYHERCGDYEYARDYARRQVTLEPWREEAHRQLIRLLALDGQRSVALTQYETCRRVLAEELAVEPTAETTALVQSIRAKAEAQENTTHHSQHLGTLPPAPTPFVGREEDLAELADDLVNPDCRWLTILGPGGIGKTRLALQAAAEHRGAFEHGVYFVPFAAVSAIDLIMPTIAHTLQLSVDGRQDPESQLLDYLAEKEMLLVLDNLEHLLAGSDVLAKLLRHAPGVFFLATSRERLNLHEERVYEIEGLGYPEQETGEIQHGYSAIDLFRQRAGQADRRFTISEAELPHVVRICQLVEGLPLGIELAASWATVYSCKRIAEELASSLDILTTRLRNVPERHRSLWAAFEYSFQLLTAEEKNAFSGLAVFRGGFSREAAKVVTGTSTLLLTTLQDKSLIRRVSPDRYTMHELLRQYAFDKLQSDSQLFERVQAQHTHYYASFLNQRESLLQGEEQKQALGEIDFEIENVRQAWQVALTQGWTDQAMQSMESLYHFYNIRCRFKEGISLFALAIDRWREVPEQEIIFGKVMAYQGILYRRLGDYDLAGEVLQQSLEIFKRYEMNIELIFSLTALAELNRSQGRNEAAVELAQQGLALSRQCGDPCSTAGALHTLGLAHYRLGQVDQAKTLLEESLAISNACGNRHLTMPALNFLGDIACHQGEYDEATLLFQKCLTLSREFDDQYNTALQLNNLGTVLHLSEQYDKAKSCYQESLAIYRQIGVRSNLSIVLSNLGEIAYFRGEPGHALEYYREALAIGRDIQDQWTILACLNNLGETACALEDWSSAQIYLAEALSLAYETQTLIMLFRALVNLARLFFDRGEGDKAVVLLELVSRHPASEQDIKAKANRLLDELSFVPSDDELVPLGVVVADTLSDLSSVTTDQRDILEISGT